MAAPPLLTGDEVQRLEAKITAAEAQTTAQLKVVVAEREWLGIRRKARRLFVRHGLHQTAQRNCVLILLVRQSRQFVIFGDAGVHQKVGQDYWDFLREEMSAEFREGRFYDGLALAVQAVGQTLHDLFPAEAPAAQDELSNAILFVA